MGHPKALAAVALGVLLTACAQLPAPLDRPFRQPGEKLLDFPAAVSKEFGCAKRKLPWFKLEESEIWPERVTPGDELGHRMVYVLCTGGATKVVTGQLETRILFRGKTLVSDPQQAYDLRPGRWRVDVFVKIPPNAANGIYALELEFVSPDVRFRDSESFAVEGAAK